MSPKKRVSGAGADRKAKVSKPAPADDSQPMDDSDSVDQKWIRDLTDWWPDA